MAAHFPPRPGTARQRCFGLRQGGFRPIGWQISGRGHCRRVPPSTRSAAGKIRRSPRTCRRPRTSVPGARRKRPNRRPGRGRGGLRPAVPGARRDDHSPQCRRIFSITSPCGGSIERDHFHLAAALGTGQRVDLVHPLDEHGPGLAGAAAGRSRCGLHGRGCGRRFRGGGFGRLPPQAAGLVRVPAVVADQVRALRRNMLRELGQEFQRVEDLEIPLGPRAGSSSCGSGIGRQASFSAL